MKKHIVLFVILLCPVILAAQGIKGDWTGFLVAQGAKYKIVFHVSQANEQFSTTFDSPDQGAFGLKIDETLFSDTAIIFNAKSLGIKYTGLFSRNKDTILGRWIQGSFTLPLVLTRQVFKADTKPVNPLESEIVLNTPTGDIHGTLSCPESKSRVPVVLIITGSGPTDRNGNSPPALQNRSNCYQLISDCLLKNNIASVRYDKRGVAASVSAGIKESELRIDTYIEDAVSWIKLLSKDKRFSKIIVAGHSEGSLIGMEVARQTRIDGYISIAGAGRPAILILKEQFRGLDPEDKEHIFEMLDLFNKGDTVSGVPQALYGFFRPSLQPYLISWFRYDPQAEISKVRCPVLIIQGGMDIQIPVSDAELLKEVCPSAELKIIPAMNHVLKDTDTKDKAEQVRSVYTNPDLPLDKEFEETMIRFIGGIR